MPRPIIRKYKPRDLEETLILFDIENRKSHGFLPEEALAKAREGVKALLQNSNEKAWIAELGGQIIGFVSTKADQDHVKLVALFVLGQRKGHGLGGRLMSKAKSVLEGVIELAVYQENSRAINFYETKLFIIQTG